MKRAIAFFALMIFCGPAFADEPLDPNAPAPDPNAISWTPKKGDTIYSTKSWFLRESTGERWHLIPCAPLTFIREFQRPNPPIHDPNTGALIPVPPDIVIQCHDAGKALREIEVRSNEPMRRWEIFRERDECRQSEQRHEAQVQRTIDSLYPPKIE